MIKLDNRIKVFIRARPLLPPETQDAFSYTPTQISIKSPTPKPHPPFSFDRVFTATSSTSEVFSYSSKPLIDHSIQGYNGTIFAYGQTTSGKTHTMIGSMQGIIPLSLSHLFTLISSSAAFEYRVWLSYLEIYNEVVNDLLDPNSINLRIREDPSEGYFVAGLKRVFCNSYNEALKVLEVGERQRSYRATNIHEHSSRSHSVFRLIVERKEIVGFDMDNELKVHAKGCVRVSVVNLVDLAGSERMNEANSDSAETAHINKSLFVLTNVINKLAESPSGHIPYRDSKLTRILSNSLGGNALTSIVCTIAPDISQLQLSLSTLRFAARAKLIKNQPVINEVIDDSALVAAYKRKIHELEAQIESITLSKDAEIAQLKAQLASFQPESIPDQRLEFVSIADLEYLEKYNELQKNYKRQVEHKNLLIEEVAEIKKRGVIGFDVQRVRFEADKDNKSEEYIAECEKMRELYLIEVASVDEKYWGMMERVYEMCGRNEKKLLHKVNRPGNKPSTENLRIRKANTKSSRGRLKAVTPQKNLTSERKEKVSTNSSFKLICEDVSCKKFI